MLFGGLLLQTSVSAIAVLIAIALIMIIGYIGEAIFKRTRVPEALILMLIGIILVPIGHLLPQSYTNTLRDLLPLFGDIALILLMYSAGKKIILYKGRIKNAHGAAFGIVDIILPTVAIAALMYYLFNWPLVYGALLGVIVGPTAAVIVLSVIKRLRITRDLYEMLLMEAVMNSVVAILLFTIITSMLSSGAASVGYYTGYVVDYISVAVFLGLFAGLLWMFVLKITKSAGEYLPTIAAAILLYGVVSFFNGAAIVSVLIFAIAMGNHKSLGRFFGMQIKPENKEMRAVEKSIEFLIKTFFFVFIGMVLTLSTQYLLEVALVVAILLVIRYAESWLFFRRDSGKRSVVFAMLPRETTTAVLAGIMLTTGLAYSSEIFFISLMVIIITNILAGIFLNRTGVSTKKA
jgi:cell volume regulation protein A